MFRIRDCPNLQEFLSVMTQGEAGGSAFKGLFPTKAILIGSVLLSLSSIALSVVLFMIARSQYRREQSVRLDPTGAARFVPLNGKLGPPAPGERRIVLFGDSRIEGWNPPLRVEGIEFVNRGWSGETTGQAVLRLDRDAIALRPEAVVIQSGINDLKGIGLLEDRQEEIVETCLRNLEAMVKRLREREIDVLLLTVFPVGSIRLSRRPIWSSRILDAVERVNGGIRRLAGPDVEVLDCDAILAEGGRMKGAFAADEFHLTPDAYRALNLFLQPKLAGAPSPPNLK